MIECNQFDAVLSLECFGRLSELTFYRYSIIIITNLYLLKFYSVLAHSTYFYNNCQDFKAKNSLLEYGPFVLGDICKYIIKESNRQEYYKLEHIIISIVTDHFSMLYFFNIIYNHSSFLARLALFLLYLTIS